MPTGSYPRKSLIDRLMERIKISDLGCWEWQGGLSHGYGRIGNNNKTYSTHRVAYEYYKGEIAAGLFVCHHCDNPKCCNPDHLFLGDQDANMKDMANKRRHSHGQDTPNSKLTSEQVEEIRALVSTGCKQKDVAMVFNISSSNVSKIMTGVSRRVS